MIERWVDRLVVAWVGAAIVLMIVPVLVFILALAAADWIDERFHPDD